MMKLYMQRPYPFLRVGDVLAGRYELIGKLGQGGAGTVYHSIDRKFEREVAVKVLGAVSDVSLRARFRQEAILVANLSYCTIVTVHDYGETDDGFLYMVQEYVDGPTLRRVIQDDAPLPPDRVVRIIDQVLGALTLAHRRYLVHRDLKPENIMLMQGPRGEETVKVLDFGIAKILEGSDWGNAMQTRQGIVLATPRYAAPEQAQQQPLGPQSDLYSLAVIIYEMLTGYTPFDADSDLKLLSKHITEPVPPFPADLAVPTALMDVVNQALSKASQDRFETAVAMSFALRHAMPGLLTTDIGTFRNPIGNKSVRSSGALDQGSLQPSISSDDPGRGRNGPSAQSQRPPVSNAEPTGSFGPTVALVTSDKQLDESSHDPTSNAPTQPLGAVPADSKHEGDLSFEPKPTVALANMSGARAASGQASCQGDDSAVSPAGAQSARGAQASTPVGAAATSGSSVNPFDALSGTSPFAVAQSKRPQTAKTEPVTHIVLLSGESAGESFELHEGEQILGRDLAIADDGICDLALLSVVAQETRITKLRSDARLTINDRSTESDPLRPGDRVVVGTMIFRCCSATDDFAYTTGIDHRAVPWRNWALAGVLALAVIAAGLGFWALGLFGSQISTSSASVVVSDDSTSSLSTQQPIVVQLGDRPPDVGLTGSASGWDSAAAGFDKPMPSGSADHPQRRTQTGSSPVHRSTPKHDPPSTQAPRPVLVKNGQTPPRSALLEPTDYDGLIERAHHWKNQGQYPQAIAAAKRALQERRHGVEAYAVLCDSLQKVHRYDDARSHCTGGLRRTDNKALKTWFNHKLAKIKQATHKDAAEASEYKKL